MSESEEPTGPDASEPEESEVADVEEAEEQPTEADEAEADGSSEAVDEGAEEEAAGQDAAAEGEAVEAEPQATTALVPTERGTTTPDARPFTYRADQQEYPVEGAVLTSVPGEHGPVDMIVMPRAVWDKSVQPNLVDRRSWYRKEAGYQKEISRLNPENNPTVVQAKELLKRLDGVLELDEDRFIEWVQGYKANAAQIRAEAQLAAMKAQLDQRKAEDTAVESETKQRAVVQQIERDIPLQVNATVQRLGVRLPDALKRDIVERLYRRAGQVYVQGWEGNPHGLQVGELRVRTDLIEDEVRYAARLLQEAGARDEKAKATEKKNQQAVGAAKRKAPSAPVTAKGSPAPGGRAEAPYKTKEDFLRDFGLNG